MSPNLIIYAHWHKPYSRHSKSLLPDSLISRALRIYLRALSKMPGENLEDSYGPDSGISLSVKYSVCST